MSTFQTELNAAIGREVNRRMGLKQDTIDKQARVLFELREQLEQLTVERDTALADEERLRIDRDHMRKAAEHWQAQAETEHRNYQAMQSRYDRERAAHKRTQCELSHLMQNDEIAAQVLRDSADERQAMQHQLNQQSAQLRALQRDSENYAALLGAIGAGSFAQAVHWVQYHQRILTAPTATQPACGSVTIGSAYDKDCNPRD